MKTKLFIISLILTSMQLSCFNNTQYFNKYKIHIRHYKYYSLNDIYNLTLTRSNIIKISASYETNLSLPLFIHHYFRQYQEITNINLNSHTSKNILNDNIVPSIHLCRNNNPKLIVSTLTSSESNIYLLDSENLSATAKIDYDICKTPYGFEHIIYPGASDFYNFDYEPWLNYNGDCFNQYNIYFSQRKNEYKGYTLRIQAFGVNDLFQIINSWEESNRNAINSYSYTNCYNNEKYINKYVFARDSIKSILLCYCLVDSYKAISPWNIGGEALVIALENSYFDNNVAKPINAYKNSN